MTEISSPPELDLDSAMDGLETLTEMTAENEFESAVWPQLSQKFDIEKFKPLLKLMYCSGAVSGALGAIEGIVTGARMGAANLVNAERERCAKVADESADYFSALERRSGHEFKDMKTSRAARSNKHAVQSVADKIRSGE